MTTRTILIFLLFGAAIAQPQGAPASVTGRIVNASTGEPVSGARLYLDRQTTPPAYFVAETGSDGVFNAVGLQPGIYKLSALRSGFTTSALRGTVTLQPDQHLTNINFRLEAEGVISGRILDADGDPVVGATLSVLRRGYIDGVATLRPAAVANVVLVVDDRGDFRIFGLAPGKYYLQAGLPVTEVARTPAAITYYGNTASSTEARAIDIMRGQVVNNVEIRLVKAQTWRVSGRIDNRTSNSAQVGVSLISADGARNIGTAGKDGAFTINGVPPGDYTLLASVGGPTGPYFFRRQQVTVGAQPVLGLNVALLPSAKLSGTVAAAGINLAGIEIHVDVHGAPQPPTQANAVARPNPDGSFQFPGLAREVYDLSVTGLPKGVYLKSARLGDVDLITNNLLIKDDEVGPIELVFANGAPTLTGTTDPAARVVLVPDGAERRANKALYRVTQAGQDGSYLMDGLMPGRYKVFAWEEVEDSAWRNDEFLKAYEDAAIPVLLEAGSEAHVEIRAKK